MERRTFKNLIIGFGKAGKTLAKSLANKGETVAIVEQSTRMYGELVLILAVFRLSR